MNRILRDTLLVNTAFEDGWPSDEEYILEKLAANSWGLGECVRKLVWLIGSGRHS